MSAAAVPLALTAMQQVQSQQQASRAAKTAASQAKQQARMASGQADAQVADLHRQTEDQKRQARNTFLRRQAERRVQGAASGAGASAEVLAGAAADNERDIMNLDFEAERTAGRIKAGADKAGYEAQNRVAKAKRSARDGMTNTLLSLGGSIAKSGGPSLLDF